MSQTLTILFERDCTRDRQEERVRFEGYRVLWPNGQPVSVGMDAFCTHGQRLLSLGRHLNGVAQRPVDLLCFGLGERDDPLTKLPGHRVRRFCLKRTGSQGRVHFLDGTPTTMVFDLEQDDPQVLDFFGLTTLPDGGERWFDLAARPGT